MNLKIEIESTELEERTITTDKGDFTVREQQAYLCVLDTKYPKQFTLQIGKDAKPYGPGNYRMCDDNLFINRFGQLALKRELNLVKE